MAQAWRQSGGGWASSQAQRKLLWRRRARARGLGPPRICLRADEPLLNGKDELLRENVTKTPQPGSGLQFMVHKASQRLLTGDGGLGRSPLIKSPLVLGTCEAVCLRGGFLLDGMLKTTGKGGFTLDRSGPQTVRDLPGDSS